MNIHTNTKVSCEGGILKAVEVRFRHVRLALGWVVAWSPSIKFFLFTTQKTPNGKAWQLHIWRLRAAFGLRK